MREGKRDHLWTDRHTDRNVISSSRKSRNLGSGHTVAAALLAGWHKEGQWESETDGDYFSIVWWNGVPARADGI